MLRRDLLRLTALGGAAALLQACGPSAPAAALLPDPSRMPGDHAEGKVRLDAAEMRTG